MSTLSKSPAWLAFSTAVYTSPLTADSLRILPAVDLEVDLSTQRHSAALEQAAAALLHQQGFEAARKGLFAGDAINWTEKRAAWHTALRAEHPPAGVAQAVKAEQERIEREHTQQVQIERERTENEAHRKTVHSEIFKVLCENGIERDVAKTVVMLAIERKLGRLMIAY